MRTLLAHYAPEREVARELYRTHVEEADSEESSGHPLVEGDEDFVARALERLEPAPGVPRRYLRPPRPALADLLSSPDVDSIAAAAVHGYSLREIAAHLGVNASTVSRRLRRRARAATHET